MRSRVRRVGIVVVCGGSERKRLGNGPGAARCEKRPRQRDEDPSRPASPPGLSASASGPGHGVSGAGGHGLHPQSVSGWVRLSAGFLLARYLALRTCVPCVVSQVPAICWPPRKFDSHSRTTLQPGIDQQRNDLSHAPSHSLADSVSGRGCGCQYGACCSSRPSVLYIVPCPHVRSTSTIAIAVG